MPATEAGPHPRPPRRHPGPLRAFRSVSISRHRAPESHPRAFNPRHGLGDGDREEVNRRRAVTKESFGEEEGAVLQSCSPHPQPVRRRGAGTERSPRGVCTASLPPTRSSPDPGGRRPRLPVAAGPLRLPNLTPHRRSPASPLPLLRPRPPRPPPLPGLPSQLLPTHGRPAFLPLILPTRPLTGLGRTHAVRPQPRSAPSRHTKIPRPFLVSQRLPRRHLDLLHPPGQVADPCAQILLLQTPRVCQNFRHERSHPHDRDRRSQSHSPQPARQRRSRQQPGCAAYWEMKSRGALTTARKTAAALQLPGGTATLLAWKCPRRLVGGKFSRRVFFSCTFQSLRFFPRFFTRINKMFLFTNRS